MAVEHHRSKSIVISGLPVSGKSTLVTALAKECHMGSYSVGDAIRAEHARLHTGGNMPFEEFYRNRSIEDQKRTNDGLKELFETKPTIGDSRFVSYLDKNTCMLVFLTAEIETRLLRAMRREEYSGKSYNEVLKILLRREEDEVRVGKELYNIDYRSQNHYHIILNSDMLAVEQEVAAIKNAFKTAKRHKS
ncbi:MAG: cytidylate kinase family protein [Candidatus Micrarchaeaceae archaeon]